MKIFASLAVGLVLLISTAVGLVRMGVGRVHHIEITGASDGTTVRLMEKLRYLDGSGFWEIRTRAVLKQIGEDPWVQEAKLQRYLPDRLVIEVQERKPLALLTDKKGKFEYVDENNTVIAEASAVKSADYPVLVKSGFKNNQELRARALELLKSLPAEGDLSRDVISEMRFEPELGFVMTVGDGGVQVNLGKDNLNLRLDRIRRVIQYLNQHGIVATRIDSDYSKKVLVKLKTRR